ncbi:MULTISPECIES: ROK family transcriptional regulator [unclassified Gordonia (in: high G+C Gram-positive bacteria)]|uniref:ROK family transcriptional regulator n=1 Tax=unclassified Gordonia (in: high G+C Gram-positive bacteria) TaxID=2657482 RepID=UPI001F0E2B66|nr:ROK family transcriptional regulator [Gordonia sp. ABSL49_1]MCH5645235.1 ROK family transcriptional regulator [Gordonia sp. ABSL49_1]
MVGVVPATLQVTSAAAAAVLHAIRVGGPVTRDHITSTTGLSAATVNRQVHALAAHGLVVERPDLIDPGAIGRPKNPLTIDRDKLCVAGMHVGARRTVLAIADLGGRTLYSHAVLTPSGDPRAAVAQLCGLLAELAGRFSGRRLLWAGVAIGGAVDIETGVVSHPVLGWRQQALGATLADALGVPVSVCEHVEAMAAAELLLTYPRAEAGSGLFFYARETAGMAMTLDGRVHVPERGAGTIAHLPVHAPVLVGGDGAGRLQDVIGDEAAESAAGRLGVQSDDPAILDERARVLGRAVAMIRDVINPDSIVVSGDAFAAHPAGLAPVQAAFDDATSIGWPLEISPSRFGVRVQEASAIVVALSVIYADPVVAVAST